MLLTLCHTAENILKLMIHEFPLPLVKSSAVVFLSKDVLKERGSALGSPCVEIDFYADVLEKLCINKYMTMNLVSTQGSNFILAASNDSEFGSFLEELGQRSYQRSLNEALCVLQTYFRISL